MDKPLSVRKEEFESSLVQLINNSGLPSYILEPIVKNYYSELKELSQIQTKQEREQYEAEKSKEEVNADEGQK